MTRLLGRFTPATLALLLLAAPAFAQRGGGGGFGGNPEERLKRQMETLKERLKLTPKQEAKVKPILEESAKKLSEARRKHMPDGPPPSDREAMRADMRRIDEEASEALGKVLTAEQIKEHEKMRAERAERFGGGRGGGRGGPPSR